MIIQKQPPRGAPWERCSENMQQISRRTPMPKFATLLHATLLKSHFGMGSVNLLHIFRVPFLKNTSEIYQVKGITRFEIVTVIF